MSDEYQQKINQQELQALGFPEAAIKEAEKLKLENNHFYFTLLGELYTDIDNDKANQHFATAVSLAKTHSDKNTIQKKIDSLKK